MNEEKQIEQKDFFPKTVFTLEHCGKRIMEIDKVNYPKSSIYVNFNFSYWKNKKINRLESFGLSFEECVFLYHFLKQMFWSEGVSPEKLVKEADEIRNNFFLLKKDL